MHPRPEDSVCIVGAGPGGLAAAWYLRERGFRNVTVLEKEQHVGGKCRTVDAGGRPYELGAFMVTWGYRNVLELARRVGAELVPQPPRRAFLLDQRKIVTIREALLADWSFTRLSWSVLCYLAVLLWYRPAVTRAGYAGATRHAALFASFHEWTKGWSRRPQRELLRIPVKDMGYGDFSDIAVLHVLRYVDFWNFITLLLYGLGLIERWPKRFAKGFQDLWIRVAGTLPAGCVERGVEIQSIRRGGDGVRVRLAGETEGRRYDWLILACPLDETHDFLDWSSTERRLFERIEYDDYYVTLCKAEGVESQIIDAISHLERGHPWEMMRAWPDGELCSFYTFAPRGVERPEIDEDIERDFAALFGGTVLQRHDQKRWRYFPRFSDPGNYDELEGLQGSNRTFYTGSLLSFETVERVVTYSRTLVRRRFA